MNYVPVIDTAITKCNRGTFNQAAKRIITLSFIQVKFHYINHVAYHLVGCNTIKTISFL